MVITCPNCDTKYSIDKMQIKGRGARVTCTNCKHVFPVYREVEKNEEEAPPTPVVEEEKVEDLDVYSLNFQQVGLKSWKVRIKLGLVYDFSDYKTLSKYLREGKVDKTDSLSHDDGKTWTPLNEIEDLERHFCEVYLLKKNQKDEPQTPVKKPKKAAPKPELSAGLNDLASVLAEAEAEVSGRKTPAPKGYKSQTRKPSPKKRPSKRKSSKAPKEEPKPKNYTFVALIALLVVAGGIWWQVSTSKEERKEVIAQQQEQKTTKKSEAQARKELQEKLAEDKKRLKAARGIVDKKEEEEPKPQELQVVIPEEILRQQRQKEQAQNGQATQASQEKGVEDYLREADSAAAQRRWAAAETAYKKAYQLKPLSNIQARWGMTLFEQNKFAEAKTILKSASSGSVEAHKWLGLISKEEGDDAQANAHFSKYLASNPKDAALIRRKMNGE